MTESPQVGALDQPRLLEHRLSRLLAVLVALTFSITLVYALVAPRQGNEVPHGASSLSRSAVGFSALVTMLESAGVPVLSSRLTSGQRVSEHRPLVLLEPPADPAGLETLDRMIHQAHIRNAPVIVVLPKWTFSADQEQDGWVAWVKLCSEAEPTQILRSVLGRRTERTVLIRRPRSQIDRWRSTIAPGALPSLDTPQLLDQELKGVRPIVWSRQGTLAATLLDTETLVISDPDLLNNAGLGSGDNAILAFHLLVEHFDATALVIDETLHGITGAPSLLGELLQPPLVLIPLHLALILLAAIWSGLDRFGRPVEHRLRMTAGVTTLVENTARLLERAEVSGRTLLEYWKLTVGRVASEIGTAPESGPDTLLRRQARMLARLGRKRGVSVDIDRLTAQITDQGTGGIDPRRALIMARDLYRWRKEMLDGSRPDR